MISQKIKTLFGKFANDYEQHMKETNHVNVQTSIIDTFLPKINGDVLDIATGTGTVARYVKKNTDCKVYGVDFSEEMVKEARKLSNGIDFKVADVTNLPYHDNSFDIITCSYGFYYFQDIGKSIEEIKRVLKPKGLVVLLEEHFPNGQNPKPRFSEKGGYLEELAKLNNYVGIDYLKKEFKDRGFKLIQEVRVPVDDIHDTVGMIYRKEAVN